MSDSLVSFEIYLQIHTVNVPSGHQPKFYGLVISPFDVATLHSDPSFNGRIAIALDSVEYNNPV